MDRQTHLNEARNLAVLAASLSTQGENLGAGEFIWGATVHAVSAADPNHERQPSDRFGNPHQAPNTNATFPNAARRITATEFQERQIIHCLDNGQKRLHNHFYHSNLPSNELREYITIGAAYAQQLIRAAEKSLLTPHSTTSARERDCT